MRAQNGQSLFEVILALGIIAFILVAVVSLASRAVSTSSFSKDKSIAVNFSGEALEWIRGERDTDWDTFYSRIGTWCLQSLAWSNSGTCSTNEYISGTSIFRREAVLADDSGAVNVTATVYWIDSQGEHQVSAATSLTNWR